MPKNGNKRVICVVKLHKFEGAKPSFMDGYPIYVNYL